MRGLFFVAFFFLFTFFIEKTTHLKPTINYNDKFEYIPIITANIYADLFIIFASFAKIYVNIKSLEGWYTKYRLAAMIADIFIGVLYILFARFLVFTSGIQIGLTAFAAICVSIQLFFDFLFFLFFTAIPKGSNDMLDYFKGYSKEIGASALLGDSFLVIFAVIISALLNQSSYDTNFVLLIISVYLVPYFIYMKD